MSTLLEKQETVQVTDVGDHDLFSHYCNKKDIGRAVFDGAEITALCGKKWRPSRDFTKFPVCQECARMLNELFPD